jgi:hypothetical protein
MRERLTIWGEACWTMLQVVGHLVFSVKVENVGKKVSYFVD